MQDLPAEVQGHATRPAGGRFRGLRWFLCLSMAVIGVAVTGWLWRGCACEFRRELPFSARRVRTARLREGNRVTLYGRADVTRAQYANVAARLGLRFFEDDLSQAYATVLRRESSSHRGDGVLCGAQPQPAWFTGQATRDTQCRRTYEYHEYRAAWYLEGTLYYARTGLWIKEP